MDKTRHTVCGIASTQNCLHSINHNFFIGIFLERFEICRGNEAKRVKYARKRMSEMNMIKWVWHLLFDRSTSTKNNNKMIASHHGKWKMKQTLYHRWIKIRRRDIITIEAFSFFTFVSIIRIQFRFGLIHSWFGYRIMLRNHEQWRDIKINAQNNKRKSGQIRTVVEFNEDEEEGKNMVKNWMLWFELHM